MDRELTRDWGNTGAADGAWDGSAVSQGLPSSCATGKPWGTGVGMTSIALLQVSFPPAGSAGGGSGAERPAGF